MLSFFIFMKLNGSYQINLEKQKVWEALNNPEILKKSIPGCEEFKKILIQNLQQQLQIRLVHLTQVLQEILNLKILMHQTVMLLKDPVTPLLALHLVQPKLVLKILKVVQN